MVGIWEPSVREKFFKRSPRQRARTWLSIKRKFGIFRKLFLPHVNRMCNLHGPGNWQRFSDIVRWSTRCWLVFSFYFGSLKNVHLRTSKQPPSRLTCGCAKYNAFGECTKQNSFSILKLCKLFARARTAHKGTKDEMIFNAKKQSN